jgi:hypothetical protein
MSSNAAARNAFEQRLFSATHYEVRDRPNCLKNICLQTMAMRRHDLADPVRAGDEGPPQCK